MSELSHPMTAPPDVYRDRRARLASHLTRPLIIMAGLPRARKYPTNAHPFRAGSNYLYFGGPPVEGAAWLIEPGSDGQDGCTLLRATKHFEEVVWIGDIPGDEVLAAAAGIDPSSIGDSAALPSLVEGRSVAVLHPPCPESMRLAASLNLHPPTPEEVTIIIDLRLIKDDHELEAMRRAARVGVQGHLAAMRAAAPGRREADVAAAFLSVLVANHCEPSFTPIISIHGEVLHSDSYPNVLAEGRLLLVDAGAEEPGGYTSDMTRTYPVNGAFTPIQRQIYDTVLRAEREAIAACRPGTRYREVHDLAARVICEGLVEAGLLRGNPLELAGRAAHTLFFVHGVGHLIGLDVHDLEEFGDLAGYPSGRTRREQFGSKYLRLDRDLEPGMTVTIEPGIYLVPAVWQEADLIRPFADVVNRAKVDELLEARFGGIRIEETICVRDAASGPEVLTAALPNDPDVVCQMVQGY